MSLAKNIVRGMERRSNPGFSMLSAPTGNVEAALLGGNRTFSGRSVSPDSALGVPAVFTAVRILAEAGRICPMQVMRPDPKDATRFVEARDSRFWRLFNVAPNPEVPASEAVETLIGHLATHGNAFLFKERDGFGRVVRLWVLHPDQVIVGRHPRGVPEFGITPHEKVYGLIPSAIAGRAPYDMPAVGTSHDVIHFRWFGTNGLVGLSPVVQLREDIALEDGHAEFAASVQENNATPGGILHTDEELSDAAATKLVARWKAAHEGTASAGKVAVLENGLKWQATSLSLVDAQFMSQRNLSIQSIARGWRIPASMFLAEAGSSMKYTTTEQEGRSFLTYTLQPILDRITAVLNADPDLEIEPGLRFNFDTDAIDSVDMLTRIRATVLLVQAGVYNRNDGRRKEGLPAVPGLDTFADPNMQARLSGDLADRAVQALLNDGAGVGLGDDEIAPADDEAPTKPNDEVATS